MVQIDRSTNQILTNGPRFGAGIWRFTKLCWMMIFITPHLRV